MTLEPGDIISTGTPAGAGIGGAAVLADGDEIVCEIERDRTTGQPRQASRVTAIDWAVVVAYFLFMLAVGLYFIRRASRSVADYFISGRDLPWWVIALSAVATYTDAGLAPAVTMLTYQGGLLGNAVWWIPYVIWMPLGAVLWSKYWRRLGTVTSAELLAVRYSGRFAEIYRGVYAAFMSFGFIVVLMGYVSGWLGAALGPILGWEPLQLMLIAGVITAAYTTTSGLYGVAYTDALQFGIFLLGNIILVPIVIAKAGGMDVILPDGARLAWSRIFQSGIPGTGA